MTFSETGQTAKNAFFDTFDDKNHHQHLSSSSLLHTFIIIIKYVKNDHFLQSVKNRQKTRKKAIFGHLGGPGCTPLLFFKSGFLAIFCIYGLDQNFPKSAKNSVFWPFFGGSKNPQKSRFLTIFVTPQFCSSSSSTSLCNSLIIIILFLSCNNTA